MTPNERTILRQLAQRVKEISQDPIMEERRQLWYAHNVLKSKRPMVLVFPEGASQECVTDKDLKCESQLARQWEWMLRFIIFSNESICDDFVVEPDFSIWLPLDPGNYNVKVEYHQGETRGSYVWDAPLKNLADDFEKLQFRKPSIDSARAEHDLALAHDTLGDILNVKFNAGFWWTCGLTQDAIKLVGMENLMMLMCTQPDDVHRLMKFLSDDMNRFIHWIEDQGLLQDTNRSHYTGSGGVAYTHELPQKDRKPGEKVRLKDIWGFAESQETVGVSPEMFYEFILPYQMPLLEQFGLNCYGCCEPVNLRFDGILKIPRLRRISISPWADEKVCAERLGQDYIYSRKPHPAPVCIDFDEEIIRKEIRSTLDTARNCNLELILKDTHTVQNDPMRFKRWVQIVREEIGG